MHPSAYLRQPTLQGDLVVFVTDDDLWSASTNPAQSSVARRLTAGLSEPSTPCLSPDGQWIAFVGRDEQHPEVYVMPSAGGPARRLTWLGPDVQVRGWTADGHIIFVTTHGQPFFRNYRAHTVSPTGGMPQRMPWGQVNHLALGGPNGAVVIGRNTADPARWKRYRGGTAGHFWIDTDGSGAFRRMSELKGNLTNPMWLGGRLYHLSDFEGVGNLYSCLPDGSDLRRHTDHEDFYARQAQTDGQRIVYQCGAELWLFDPAAGDARRLVIDTPAHRTQATRKFVSAVDHVGDLHVHPAGHSLAADVRGKLFSFALWEGAVRQHGKPDQAGRHRHGQWLADGTTLVAISDASGEEAVVVWNDASTGDAERVLPWEIGRVIAMSAAPRGTQIAIANHRSEVWLGDVASGALVRVDHSEFGRTEDLAWSADGAWLAYSYQADARHVAIKLYDVAAKQSTLVTQPEFRDYSPAFDPEGKYLYFLSYRTFDPVYDSVQFDLSFPRASRPFLIALQAGGRPPFDPAPKGFKGDEGDPAKDKTSTTPPAPLHIDLQGIALRVAPFPVREDRFAKIAGAAGGKVLWTVQTMVGAHGRGGHKEEPGKLEVFDFVTARTETMMARADSFTVSADQATVVVREGKRVRALGVKRRAEPEHAPVADAPSRKTGWIDLARIRVSVEPRLEWQQMLREVWRLQRDQFWLANMSGLDWDAVYARYSPLLERVSTRAELSDLIWELQGELGTSHAYEMGGDHRRPPQIALGCLAADLQFVEADQSYEITRIVRGDTWEASADSPLNAVGVEARVGERIVAVNGQRVSRELPPQALLVSQAGAKVELTLATAEGAALTRNVVVTLLADEVPARYREWVEKNRAWVHEQSGGRVGYFHLPDMMAAGFAEFHRYFSTECDRDGLIVDLRYNRGGHVSPLLLEKIARKRIGYDIKRWGLPSSYPDEAVAGPVMALTNEHAGSDGDIFSHGFKLMGLGPLVGKRTWGGVIGIWPRHKLVDGTETTQPEFSFWFKDVGWGVENHGTDPDIEIDNAPQDAVAGHDRQLETALATVQGLIGEGTRGLPDFGPPPDLNRPPLPPRR